MENYLVLEMITIFLICNGLFYGIIIVAAVVCGLLDAIFPAMFAPESSRYRAGRNDERRSRDDGKA